VIELGDVAAVVTDIEGTTSSLAFVKEQLFPYARRELSAYVRAHASSLGEIATQIRAAAGASSLSTQAMIDTLMQWMDEDRKITPLKTLQGMIWKEGYEHGQLRGHVYEDAARALRAWHAAGIRLYVYSSGSVEAQKLLFGHSSQGDLTPLLSGYFDTVTGPKLEPRSYQSIAAALGLPPSALVFLSDHPGETHAAAAAGMQTILLAREQHPSALEPAARSFDDIALSTPSRCC
jgi:enolase-phosphatase E1